MPDQPPARRTQRERREETERKVLAAATALIAQHGSRALTLAAVGEAAGYSRGIVSHHFGSRENLLRAVMRDAQAFARMSGIAPRTGWRGRFAPTSRTSPTDVRLPARSCRCGARRLPPIPS
jgi:AcrR family transcriptional regulator